MGALDRVKKIAQWLAPQNYQDAAVESSQGNTKFSPGVPIRPADGYSRPARSFDFLTGYNIAARPRHNERVSFPVLRQMVELYDIAQICINHRIDSVRSLDWALVPATGVTGDVSEMVAAVKEILRKPDGHLPFRAWLGKFLYDVLAYDAGTLQKRYNNAGNVIGLRVIDGTMIAPLIDYFGNVPTGDAPAYVQYAQGVPWEWLTDTEVIYVPMRPMPNSMYGKSPLETILLNANIDLRFQNYFLNWFTEGTVPEGLATSPETWGPDQIAEFQEAFDAVMQGDEAKKSQIRWVPAGTTFTWPTATKFDSDFSLFLMRKTAAAYSITPSDLGFTEDVNRSTGDTQADVQFRIGDKPLIQHVQDILTEFIQQDLGYPLKFVFDTGEEVEDRLQSMQVAVNAIQNGVLSLSEVREKFYGLQEPDGIAAPRFVFTARGGPIPLSAIKAVAGPTDPATGAPMPDAPLPKKPFAPVEGVVPNPPPMMPPLAVQRYGDLSVPAAEAPTVPVTADVEKAEGITTATGVFGSPLLDDEEDDEEEFDDDELMKSELSQFARFTKARIRDGRWRDFKFQHIPDVQARMLNREARESGPFSLPKSSDAPFLAEPVAKSWRDSADKVPQHAYDIKLVDYYTPEIQSALEAFFDSLNVSQVASSVVVKAIDPEALMAQVQSLLGDNPSTADIESTLRKIIADSYLTGAHGAATQLGAASVSLDGVSAVDWDNWKPGDTGSALKTADGGLKAALDQAGVTVKGITDTVMNQVGNGIAQGLASGNDPASIARDLRDTLGSRAKIILQTEVARAQTAGSFDSYTASGVTQWDWVVSDDPCDDCAGMPDGNPYDMGADGPPLHPYCRCAASPVVDSIDASNIQTVEPTDE